MASRGIHAVSFILRAGLCSPGPAAVEKKKVSSERNCFKRVLKYRLKKRVQQTGLPQPVLRGHCGRRNYKQVQTNL